MAGEAAGWLLDRASTYLRERGQYRQAKPLAERALAVTEAALGPDHPDVAWRRDELGRVLRDLGDLPAPAPSSNGPCRSARRPWAPTTPTSASGAATSAACCRIWVT